MAEAETITRRQTTARVKGIIAKKKNRRLSQILLRHNLRTDLRFTTAAVRGLAVPINDAFGRFNARITTKEAGDTKTVLDLRDLVWKRIPAARKA